MTSRIQRAILIGPGVVPAGVFIFAITTGFRLRESVALTVIYGAFSYGGSLILGVPAHLALGRSGLTSLWHYLIAGAMLGTLVPVIVVTVLEQIALLSPAAVTVCSICCRQSQVQRAHEATCDQLLELLLSELLSATQRLPGVSVAGGLGSVAEG